jgi:hypothetical protein
MTTLETLKSLRLDIARVSEQLLRARSEREYLGQSTQRQHGKNGESYLAYPILVQSSPDRDRLARSTERVDELEERLDDLKSQVRDIIGAVESEQARQVLTRFYLWGWTARHAATALHKSHRDVMRFVNFKA